jgi:hypothetical protein
MINNTFNIIYINYIYDIHIKKTILWDNLFFKYVKYSKII